MNKLHILMLLGLAMACYASESETSDLQDDIQAAGQADRQGRGRGGRGSGWWRRPWAAWWEKLSSLSQTTTIPPVPTTRIKTEAPTTLPTTVVTTPTPGTMRCRVCSFDETEETLDDVCPLEESVEECDTVCFVAAQNVDRRVVYSLGCDTEGSGSVCPDPGPDSPGEALWRGNVRGVTCCGTELCSDTYYNSI